MWHHEWSIRIISWITPVRRRNSLYKRIALSILLRCGNIIKRSYNYTIIHTRLYGYAINRVILEYWDTRVMARRQMCYYLQSRKKRLASCYEIVIAVSWTMTADRSSAYFFSQSCGLRGENLNDSQRITHVVCKRCLDGCAAVLSEFHSHGVARLRVITETTYLAPSHER